MSALLRRYPVITALTVLVALLLVVLALEISSGAALRERLAASATPRTAPVQTRLLPAIAAVNPDQEYAETTARPLFTPTRRPAPPAVVAGAAASMVKGQYILTGVIIANGLKTALLREKSSGRVVRVEKGKEINGLTVAEIEPEKVTLAQGGDQEVVGLAVHKGPVPAPTAPGHAPGANPPAPTPSGPFSAPATVTPSGAPQVAAPAPDAGGNPAARAQAAPPPPPTSGFGPPPNRAQQQSAADAAAAAQAPLTPEELLARRRARRSQSTQ